MIYRYQVVIDQDHCQDKPSIHNFGVEAGFRRFRQR